MWLATLADQRVEIQIDTPREARSQIKFSVSFAVANPTCTTEATRWFHVIEDPGGGPEPHQPLTPSQALHGSAMSSSARMRELIATHCILLGARKVEGVEVLTPHQRPRWLPEALSRPGPGFRVCGVWLASWKHRHCARMGVSWWTPGFDEATGLLYSPVRSSFRPSPSRRSEAEATCRLPAAASTRGTIPVRRRESSCGISVGAAHPGGQAGHCRPPCRCISSTAMHPA